MAQSILEIPEWTGSPLTMASFLAYSTSINSNLINLETENQYMLQLGQELNHLVVRFQDFINQQRAYEQTPEIAKQDNKRDSLWKALWYAWYYATWTACTSVSFRCIREGLPPSGSAVIPPAPRERGRPRPQAWQAGRPRSQGRTGRSGAFAFRPPAP